jgi:hypothetical protein
VSSPVRQLTFITILSSALLAASVRADGEQLMPSGASSVARGGASAARPTDLSTMLRNPAGLVDLAGNSVFLSFDTGFSSICARPYGYYGWGVYDTADRAGSPADLDAHQSEFGDPTSTAYSARHLDSVCNSAPVGPLPSLAFSFHLGDRLVLALGLITPVGVATQFGGKDGTIAVGKNQARPTPTRYDAITTEAIGADPTVSAAYSITPWLAVGATLQVLMGSASTYSVLALRAGTSPATDMYARAHGSDYFVPALTLAAYAKPTRRIRLAGSFTWQEGADGHGDLTITTGYYHSGATGNELVPYENDPVKLKRVRAGLPWLATLAARYAQPSGKDADSSDPMKNQIWDVELDADYTANSGAGPTQVQIANDFSLGFRRANGTPEMPLDVKQENLKQLNVETHLLDMIALRAGGSYNVLPGLLAVSAGGFFQSRSSSAAYASVANFGFARVGLGLGATVRVGSVELMAAYAHIFQEEINLAPPPAEPRTQATSDPRSGFDQRIYQDSQLSDKPVMDPKAPSPSAASGVASGQQTAIFETSSLRARVVNAGRYVSSFNVLSLSIAHHF